MLIAKAARERFVIALLVIGASALAGCGAGETPREGRSTSASLRGSRATPVAQCAGCDAQSDPWWDEGSGMQWCMCGAAHGSANASASTAACEGDDGCDGREPVRRANGQQP